MKILRAAAVGVFLLCGLGSISGIHSSANGVPAASPSSRDWNPTPTVSRGRIAATTPTPLGTPVPGTVATPEPVRTGTPVPASTPTLADLQTAIHQRLFDPVARHGRIGIKAVSLATGKVIVEQDSDKYFVPASNMKNFTVATALEKLGPNFKFVTSVYAAAPVDASGTVHGDLRIFGRGDVSMSTFFATKPTTDPDIYYERLDRLADAIVAAGVKRIDGNLVADESYFTGNAVPNTWEWDDLQWTDGEEVSALPINNNAVDLVVRGGKKGDPCGFDIFPATPSYQVVNNCTVAAGGSGVHIGAKKALDRNIVTISGTIAANEKWSQPVTVTHPAEVYVTMLKDRLQKKGVVVTGGARTMSAGATPTERTEITHIESPPFSEIAAKTMKPSQNMFAETILWTIGEEIGRKNGGSGDSYKLGLDVVKNFLQQAGITADSVDQYDGSGVSRHDLVTPDAIVRLYTYMAKESPNAVAWRNSLAVGGKDGTLRNRFKGTRAAENFAGKTGTLDQVSALSGYVTTASGEQVVVSIIVNNVPLLGDRLKIIDGIVVQLANYTGRVDQ